MATNEVQIFNMALNAIGNRDDVSATTEESREAEVCRLWFGPVRDHVLRAAPWPCAKAFARLALVSTRDENLAWTSDDPEPGFMFAYATPAKFLAPRYLTTFNRFTLSARGTQMTINTQQENAVLCYTVVQDNVSLWDPQLTLAIAFALGAFISLPLHGKPARARLVEEHANQLVYQARENAANSDENQYETIPDWIAARGFALSAPQSRFYWPNGPMISVSEQAGVS